MPDNHFSKAMADGKVAMRLVNLVAQTSKLKVRIGALRRDREARCRAVGSVTYGHFREKNALDAQSIMPEIRGDLDNIQQIDKEITECEEEISRIKEEFRAQGATPPAS